MTPVMRAFLTLLDAAPSYSMPDPQRPGHWIVYRLVRDEDARIVLRDAEWEKTRPLVRGVSNV